jgi:ribosome-binding protein aMBF1 (putative translation factor)
MSDPTGDDRSEAGRPEPRGEHGGSRRHGSVFPGFREMSERRRELASRLAAERVELGLTQTEVAARMGTSQSAVARLESGAADVRISTLERYAAALDRALDLRLLEEPARRRDRPQADPTERGQ